MSSEPSKAWQRPKTPRYVVSVDNQAKSAFDTQEAADAEARRISGGFPQVVVRVTDSEEDSLTRLEVTQESIEPDAG